jgi:hypothetical protein
MMSPSLYFIHMISTKSLISELQDIPREWVFEYYLKLTEKLCGQDVRIKSPFNSDDKVPSTYVYYSKALERYKFKDFSTGKHGDGITLVQALFNLTSRGETAHKVISDYNQFILNNKEDYSLREFKLQQKYKVSDFKKRNWTNVDQKFWTQFHIGSKLLEHYNVFPLESYTMTKEIDGDLKQLTIEGRHHIYGYFRTDGTLYKIYQPMVKENKFIKIREYIQGTDQLTYKTKYLVICSSLKDVMAFMKLNYKDVEAVAPDSENTLIPPHVITAYKLKYKGICTLFDNDKAGIEAMAKYGQRYELSGVILPLSKDLSDSMKDHGILRVKEELTPLLKSALK